MMSCSLTALTTCAGTVSNIKDSDRGPVIQFCPTIEFVISDLLSVLAQFGEEERKRENVKLEKSKEDEDAKQLEQRIHNEIHANALQMDEVRSRSGPQDAQAPNGSDWTKTWKRTTSSDFDWNKAAELPERQYEFSSWTSLQGSHLLVNEEPLINMTLPVCSEEYVTQRKEPGMSSAASSKSSVRSECNPVARNVYTSYHNKTGKHQSSMHPVKKKATLAMSQARWSSTHPDEPSSHAPSTSSLVACAIQKLIEDTDVPLATETLTAAVLEESAEEVEHDGRECKYAIQ